MVFDSIVEYMAHCEDILQEPADEHAAFRWRQTIPPEGWARFPQALRLTHKVDERLWELVSKIYTEEEKIEHAEWLLAHPE